MSQGSQGTRFSFSRRVGGIALMCLTSMGAGIFVLSSQPRMVYAGSPGCVGDCNDDGVVTVDEIVLLVNIVLGISPISSCPTLTEPPDVADVVLAINAALTGCAEMSTPTPSPTPTVTPTSIVTTFELAEGSTITRSTGDTTPIEEPLTGSFTLVLDHYEPQSLIFFITALEFRSEQSIVTLANGERETDMSFDCPSALAHVAANVFIDSEFFIASGITTFINDCSFHVSAIEPFDLCTNIQNISQCDEIKAGSRSGYVLGIIPVLIP